MVIIDKNTIKINKLKPFDFVAYSRDNDSRMITIIFQLEKNFQFPP